MRSTVRRRLARVAAPVSAGALALLAVAPAHADAPSCSQDCRLAAAHSYIQALVTHDASNVPLHPQATRVEAGLQTGYSGPQIRTDLTHGPQYRVIRGVRDEHDQVVNGTVHTDYLLDVGLGPVPLTTARVQETFTFQDGGIRTINAHISIEPGAAKP